MLASLARLSAVHYKVVLFVTAIFVAVAFYAFRGLPIEAYPDVTDPMVEVVTVFPGQSAEEVERRVTLELERVLAGTPGLTNLRSVSVFGLSLVTLRFEERTVDRHNRTYVAEMLREAVLPDGIEASIGPQATPVGQILRYTVHGPHSLRELRAIQDWTIERQLRSVPGVADVVTFGGFERQFAVRIDPVRLTNMGVTIREVFEAIDRANSNAGGGYVGVGSQEFVVRGLGTIRDPAELAHALVRHEEGMPIRIRDVADVVESSTPRRGSVGRGHDDEVVQGIVLLRRDENPSIVLRNLHARIAELEDGILPSDVRMDIFYDRQVLIDHTVSTVGRNLFHGALLVVLIVFAFLRSWRAALIVGAVIPLTLLASFLGLRTLGMSANLISLGAIDFGILVEPAAVLVEVTMHTWAVQQVAVGTLGTKDRLQGMIAAARSVSRPVVFATLIIIAGLVPLFLLERVEGRIFAPMAYTYMFALIAAPVAALTVVPALIYLLMRGKIPQGEGRVFVWLKHHYGALLGKIRHARLVVVTVAILSLFGIGFYASRIGTEFLPELNEGGIYITAVFPSTIALDETRRHIPDVRNRLLALHETEEVLSHLGRPEDATQIEGPNNAEFFVKLLPMKQWRSGYNRQDLESELRQSLAEIPGVQFNFSQPITDRVFETVSGIIGQVVVKVRGEDLEAMTDLAEEIRDRIQHVEGIEDLSIYQAGDIPQLRIDLDRERLATLGIAVDDVQEVVEIALGGKVATEIWQGEQRFGVALRLPDYMRRSTEEIGRIVVGDTANQIKLSEVADIGPARGRSAIWRENLSRFVAVKFNVRGRDLGSTVADARQSVADLQAPERTVVSWGGEFENQQRAMKRLSVVVPITILVMVLILFMNFKRWGPTFTIIAILPLSLVCAVAFLRVSGETFSVSSAIGCITLIGQTVLLGVLMCTRIDEQQRAGAADPVLEGAKVALRPILLTVSLASLALVPAALSYDMGAESQRPFARALIGGLVTSLPVVLLLLPVLYRPKPDPEPEEINEEGKGGTGSKLPSAAVAGILMLVGALAISSPAHAQESATAKPMAAGQGANQGVPTEVMTEAALLERWLAHGLEVRAMRQEIGAARFDVVQARVLPNPELEVGGLFVLAGDPPDGVHNYGAELSWQLPIDGKVGARREAAERALDVAETRVAYYLWQRGGEIRESVVETAFTQARQDLVEAIVEELGMIESIVAARARAGLDPAYDALRVEVLGETLQAEVGGTKADLAEAQARMLALIADPQLERAPIGPEGLLRHKADVSVARQIQIAFDQRPDLLLARRSAVAYQALARQYRVEARPSPSLILGTYVTRDVNSVSVIGGVSIPLPIFDRNQGFIGRAQTEAHRERILSEALETQIRREVSGTESRRQHAEKALGRFRQRGFQQAEDLMGRAQRAYMGGMFTIVELLDAFEAAWEARRQELALMQELAEAEAELVRVIGLGGIVPRGGR